jgi:hypothetical protein
MARTKLNDRLRDAAGEEITRADLIIQVLQSGQTAKSACAIAGVTEQSYYLWLRRGDVEPRGQYHDFRDAVRKAIAEAERHLIAVVNRTIEGGIVELVHRDELGTVIIDRRTGKPKVSLRTMLPDGKLAAHILAVRNPADWAPGRTEGAPTPDELPPALPPDSINLLRDAISILLDSGEVPPQGITLALPEPDDGNLELTATKSQKSCINPEEALLAELITDLELETGNE